MIVNDTCQQVHLDNLRHKDTVDNQRDIIPHQHGGNKVIRITEEAGKDARRNARLTLHFKAQLIYGNKSNLHTRKEGRESHGYQQINNSIHYII